jgi:hypothetical protein
MTQFKSLSEKSHRNAYEDTPDLDNQYDEKDVKEFIRLLKEACGENDLDVMLLDGEDGDITIPLLEYIDKLAGDKLI